MKKLAIATLVVATSISAEAKEYLGFNLCERMTRNEISAVAEKAATQFTEEDDNLPGARIFEFPSYPIIDGQYEAVRVKTYQDHVYSIEIVKRHGESDLSGLSGLSDLSDLLDQKYGVISKRRETRGSIDDIIFVYSTAKHDSKLALTFTISENAAAARAGLISVSMQVTYACKGLSGKVRDAMKANEKRKALDKIGTSKI